MSELELVAVEVEPIGTIALISGLLKEALVEEVGIIDTLKVCLLHLILYLVLLLERRVRERHPQLVMEIML